MRTFEYRTQRVLGKIKKVDDVLNSLGAEGWDLVSAHEALGPRGGIVVFLKRETSS